MNQFRIFILQFIAIQWNNNYINIYYSIVEYHESISVEFMWVPHHGRKYNQSDEWYSAVSIEKFVYYVILML